MLLSPNPVFCRWLLNSLRKEDQQRKKIAFSFCVRHNCCLCVKFGSQGIIFELRTCFSPQSRRSHLMWFSRSCMSESDGLPIEYCKPRIGRTEFQAVVTFLICGTILLLWWQFSCFAVSWGFWVERKIYERSLQALLSLPHRPLLRLLLRASRASTFHDIPKWRACS